VIGTEELRDGYRASRPSGHSSGHACGYEHLKAAGESQTWFSPFTTRLQPARSHGQAALVA
jgi:hypothetical protein